MGVGARVFKGRCTPAEKRAKRRAELEPAYHKVRRNPSVISYQIHRRPATAAHALTQIIFSNAIDYGRRLGW